MHIIFNRVLAMHLDVNATVCSSNSDHISESLCAVLNKGCVVLLHPETQKCGWYKEQRKLSEPYTFTLFLFLSC